MHRGKVTRVRRTEEQKLIYSGQLLHDTVVLKDILRQYEGQETHTVHLVFTPKMNPRDSASGSAEGTKKTPNHDIRTAMDSEGLRQRRPLSGDQVGNGTEGSGSGGASATRPNNGNGAQFGEIPQPQQNMGHFTAAQHLAYHQWLQQAYVDYMNQYMSLMSRPGVQGMYQPPQVPSYFQQGTPAVADPVANVEVQAAPAEAQAAAEPNPPQPRFPNLVRDEGPEQRDWLDIFYALSRLFVLITLVYFYSSPTRCLIVVAIGILIYLYHTGFFRNLAPAEGNNNNNAARNAAVGEARQPPQNAQNNNDAQQPNNEADEASDAVVRDETNRIPVIAFLRTFVLSFFASLIPEAAAL
uniref:Ubiquitin-like domain-containing protein n=1 Tax=Phlebotomus papatasi TaxID=29031 RepID=A0A1B0DM18_PHLPP